MRRDFEYITFDCYGTLINWERGIARAFMKAAGAAGIAVMPEDVLRLHAEIEPQVQTGGYRSYREVLTETAKQMARRLGWNLDKSRAGFLAETLSSWRPFPDTNSALERLAAAGFKLGILSNIDDDLLAATLRHFPVTFDLLITAQQVRSYKPAHAHFLEFRKRLGDIPWLHAAQSYFHDVGPCAALGIPVVWVNRKHEPARGDAKPEAEVATLEEFADLLGGRDAC